MKEGISGKKRCTGCKKNKWLKRYPPDLRRKDGRGSKCRGCARQVTEDRWARYPEVEAIRRQRNAEHSKKWYRRNRESQLKRQKWNVIKRKYGMTEQDYVQLLGSQKNRCALCRTKEPGREDGHFCVDHDHTTGAVRGLLCQRCNSGIGFFRDNPKLMRKGAKYVEEAREKEEEKESCRRSSQQSCTLRGKG